MIIENAMTGLLILDIFIGLFFTYTLYSLLTTVIVELVAANVQLRARNLRRAIRRMLDDEGQIVFSKAFYDQPMIKYLASGLWKIFNKPAYIKSRNFSKAVMEVLKGEDKGNDNSAQTIATKIKSVLQNDNTETGRYLYSLYQDAQGDLMKFRAYLEEWFDDTMERASGWYKKRIQVLTIVVGFAVCFAFNVDTITLVKKLSTDPKLREQYVQLASELAANDKLDPKNQSELNTQLRDLSTLMKKSDGIISIERGNFWDVNFVGILISAVALSLGAPFWFDLLNNIMQLRTSVTTGLKSKAKSGSTEAEGLQQGIVPAKRRKG